MNDTEYSKIWVDIHTSLRHAVELELARACAAKIGQVDVHGLLGGSSFGLSDRIRELASNLSSQAAEISVLYRAIITLAQAARLGNELSMYAAASKNENTADFVIALIDKCDGVQDAYESIEDNLICRAAVKIAQRGAEAGGDARPTDARFTPVTPADGPADGGQA